MRRRSRRCSESFSRRRDKLFCFRADDVRVASESRRRPSCDMTVSRFDSRSSSLDSVSFSSGVGFGGMLDSCENCEYV